MQKITVEGAVRIWAGVMLLVSVALVVFVSKWWLLFTTFIGLNLIQSGITGFCPPSMLFRKMGLPEKTAECATEKKCCC